MMANNSTKCEIFYQNGLWRVELLLQYFKIREECFYKTQMAPVCKYLATSALVQFI